MRRARIKADGAGYYHCMSRVIERRHIFGAQEKERFRFWSTVFSALSNGIDAGAVRV